MADIKYDRGLLLQVCTKVKDLINPYCEIVTIGGSLRRLVAKCKDIEIVCIPKFTEEQPLFGESIRESLLENCDFTALGKLEKNGPRYKQIKHFMERVGNVMIDLFIVLPPAQYGVILAIRTGSANFSKRLVLSKKHGGFLPENHYIKDGSLREIRHPDDPPEDHWIYCTPDEETFFKQMQMTYIEPKDRK